MISVGDVVRLESEVSFTKNLVDGAETNSAPFFFFGFRAGPYEGSNEFHPNQGISQALAYNLGADGAAADPADSNVQARLVGDGASAPENALINVEDAGMDFSEGDFTTDVLMIRSDAEYISETAAGATFEVTTSLWTGGTQISEVTSTVLDPGISRAGNRVQFAIRDGAPGVTDLTLHRLSASFNPNDAAVLLGDFDLDGDVDLDDLDQYNGNLDMAATGDLEALDLDGNGMVDAADFQQHYSTLVETSNGQKGTFAGDVNLDGTVNVLGDAFALVGNLNMPATSWSQGDLNADGMVNVLGDAFALVGNLGQTNNPSAGAPAASAVPEPGSLSLLTLAGIGVFVRRKRA